MTNISPPAPPLPFLSGPEKEISKLLAGDEKIKESTCLWDLNVFEKKCITKVKPVAQSGPNCGIAALAMVTSLTPSKLSVDDIFEKAKSQGFTKNGEMFSAKNMKSLTDSVLHPWFKTEMITNGLSPNESYVVERLYCGDLMLIPYDADKDHSPCCRNGHKAHWALVCGVMTDFDGKVSVAAQQGKSQYLAVWPLDRLQHSNDNLAQLDPERTADGREYVLPEGGVKEGLASQLILIRR